MNVYSLFQPCLAVLCLAVLCLAVLCLAVICLRLPRRHAASRCRTVSTCPGPGRSPLDPVTTSASFGSLSPPTTNRVTIPRPKPGPPGSRAPWLSIETCASRQGFGAFRRKPTLGRTRLRAIASMLHTSNTNFPTGERPTRGPPRAPTPAALASQTRPLDPTHTQVHTHARTSDPLHMNTPAKHPAA